MMSSSITLEPRLDLRAANALTRELAAHSGADMTLDASAVTQIGALAVQTIRAAARSWTQSGHSLRFENVSTDLADQLVLLGFSPDSLTKWEQPT